MKLTELFAAKMPTNKIVWKKRGGTIEKSYEIEPTINKRVQVVKKEQSGKQQ